MYFACIVHVFNAGRSKIQAVAGPKSRCFGPDPALDISRNGLRRPIHNMGVCESVCVQSALKSCTSLVRRIVRIYYV